MPAHDLSIPGPDTPRLRSGTAARLAGLPVTTLRVWERRYGVAVTPKASNGQRLYSENEVQRLGLLKQLTGRGHAIGTIAALDRAGLQALLAGLASQDRQPLSMARQVVVVGLSAAHKLKAAAAIDVVALHEDIEQAERQAFGQDAESGGADLLLLHLPSLQPALAKRVQALGARLGTRATIVVYAFGANVVAQSLRAAGVTVCREPVSGRELARLLASTPLSPPAMAVQRLVAPRRFSDAALMDIIERPSRLACECQRHVAEIVQQLASFERYSADCSARSPADAAMHQSLGKTAGAARTLFESSLHALLDDSGRVPAPPVIDPDRFEASIAPADTNTLHPPP